MHGYCACSVHASVSKIQIGPHRGLAHGFVVCRQSDAPPAAAYIVPDARSSATLRQDEPASVLLALADDQQASPGPTPKLGAVRDPATSDFALPTRSESPDQSTAGLSGGAPRFGAGADAGDAQDEPAAPYPGASAFPGSPNSALTSQAASARPSFEDPLTDRAASPALQGSNTEAHKLFNEEAADSPKALPTTTRGRSTSGSRRARTHRSPRKEMHALGGLSGDSDTDAFDRRDAAQSRKSASRLSHS